MKKLLLILMLTACSQTITTPEHDHPRHHHPKHDHPVVVDTLMVVDTLHHHHNHDHRHNHKDHNHGKSETDSR